MSVAWLTHALRIVLLIGMRAQLNFPTPSYNFLFQDFSSFIIRLIRLFFNLLPLSFIYLPLYGVAVSCKIEHWSLILFDDAARIFVFSLHLFRTKCTVKESETRQHEISFLGLHISMNFFYIIYL